MLILTRRVGEVTVINKNIEITILGVKGNQVKLGFVAPDDVIINREEIQQRIDREKKNDEE